MDSPFDFAAQALLYLPDPLPSPNSEHFAEDVADAAWPVICASGGRAFVLCATLKAVERSRPDCNGTCATAGPNFRC